MVDLNPENDACIWYNYDLSDNSQYIKCIKHLQKIIRGSMSYDVWQKRSKIGVYICPVCGESNDYIKFESHHYPKTLFDIVDEYLQHLIDLNQIDEKTDFDVAQEIMDMHLRKDINYIVLCQYCHKKYHDNVPDVLDAVENAWKEIIENRKDKNNGKNRDTRNQENQINGESEKSL